MKKFSILALAAVGLLVAACSTKDIVEEGYQDVTKGKGQGFINVAISLPTQEGSSTRAWGETDGQNPAGNGQLDDGAGYEYNVNEVLLIIFGGESEATATVQQVVSPTAGTWSGVEDTPSQVTTRKNYVVKLDEDATGPFWILAVLNGNGVIGMADSKNISINGVKKEGAKLSDLQDINVLAEFQSEGVTKFANATTSDNFFMTNAVLSKTVSGTEGISYRKDATILAPVTKVFVSQSEATNSTEPSADIYVERGLVKVTVAKTEAFTFDDAILTSGGAAPTATPTFKWVLDNTNRRSFIVRKVNEGDWGLKSQSPTAARDVYRFVGYNNVDAVAEPITTAYRTYWSPDPNYSGTSGDYNKQNFYEPKNKTFPADASKPQYCYENTFDVDHQTYENTTRVVVAVDLNGEGTAPFYTLGADRKTLYSEDDIKRAVYARIIQEQDFQTWFTANRAGSTTELNEDIFDDLEWNDEDKAGVIHAKDVTIKASALSGVDDIKISTINETLYTGNAILKSANVKAGKINRFVNGIAYYAIRIKHFGDDLTPWNTNEYGNGTQPAEPGINDIYPPGNYRDANYLGRYGVLRNNWYQLSLGTILKIGHPIVPWLNPDNDPNPDTPKPDDPTDPDPDNPDDPNPEDPDHPDDSLEDTYLNARINILSWALRPQSWSLK